MNLFENFNTLIARGMKPHPRLGVDVIEDEIPGICEPEWGLCNPPLDAPDEDHMQEVIRYEGAIPDEIVHDLLVMHANRHFGLRCLTLDALVGATK